MTGATRGIGRAVVEGLAEQGHSVLLGARNLERGRQVAEQITGDVEPVQIDVTEHRSVAAAASRVNGTYGYLDTLVNNAGINVGYQNPPSQTTQDDLHAIYATDVFGLVDTTLMLLPLPDRSVAPRIVNVSSLRGSLGSQDKWVGPWSMAYGSAKTAVNSITVHLARELGGRGYAVSAVSPGHVATDLTGRNEPYRHGRTSRPESCLPRPVDDGKGDAPLTPKQGAATVIALASAMTTEANGKFLDENGQTVPW